MSVSRLSPRSFALGLRLKVGRSRCRLNLKELDLGLGASKAAATERRWKCLGDLSVVEWLVGSQQGWRAVERSGTFESSCARGAGALRVGGGGVELAHLGGELESRLMRHASVVWAFALNVCEKENGQRQLAPGESKQEPTHR